VERHDGRYRPCPSHRDRCPITLPVGAAGAVGGSGPPVTLLVRMLPGQLVDDFHAQAHRIAAGMDVPMVGISSCGHGLIKVALLDHEPQSAVLALSA
jgi:hypothetical protein